MFSLVYSRQAHCIWVTTLGAIKNFVELQNKYNCVYCVVDQHAITVDQDPKELRSNILEVLASFIAAGVDYKKQIIFQQSSVPAHSQLALSLIHI